VPARLSLVGRVAHHAAKFGGALTPVGLAGLAAYLRPHRIRHGRNMPQFQLVTVDGTVLGLASSAAPTGRPTA